MSKTLIALTEDTFSDTIKTGTTLVDFYADWCGPCRKMAPVLEQVAQEIQAEVKIAKLDIEAHSKVAHQFQITAVPTFVLFHEGKEVARFSGIKDVESMKEFIASAKK